MLLIPLIDGVTVANLISWNPSLAGLAPCSFQVGQQYCVQNLALNFTNITPYCRKQYLAGPGDTCASVMAGAGIGIDQFYAWNPAVGATCQTWQNGMQT